MSKRKRRDKFEAETPHIEPLTQAQAALIEAIETNDMVVATGPAGTGKTYVITVLAAEAFKQGFVNGGVDKIILTRPNVASGPPIGFRPGTMQDKMAEWFAEQLRILRDTLGDGTMDTALKSGNIELVPLETMRGRSFNGAMVLLDEAQNMTPDQMRMITTRIGDGSTFVINGDESQSDYIDTTSGLTHLLFMVKKYKLPVSVVRFTLNDVVRSGICRDFVRAYYLEDSSCRRAG